jgi:hypothetical protein
MVRPSFRVTLIVSFVNFTAATRSSAVRAKMAMPSLQQCVYILRDYALNSSGFLGGEPAVPRELDGLQPKLDREIVPIDMHMQAH